MSNPPIHLLDNNQHPVQPPLTPAEQHKQMRIGKAVDLINFTGHILPAALAFVGTHTETGLSTAAVVQLAHDLAESLAIEHMKRAEKRITEAAK